MGGLYSRVKTWVSTEDVNYSDLNAEFDNILTNFVPLMIDDYSTDVTQMQVTADPGELATESKATTLAGELARLRHMIKEITGKTYWYQSPSDSLAGLASAVGTSVSVNRLISGRLRSSSDFPTFLVPSGVARTVTCKGASTNFLYYVNGTQYTISSDVTLTSLTAAPSSNNTCLVNDANASDQDWTKYQGEGDTVIPIDTVGSEITALVGKIAAFKIAGTTDEYFIARVETDHLHKAFRGFFLDSSDVPIPRAGYTNNDTITLMKLAWIFAKTDGTLTVCYTNPVWAKTEPSSPASGDFWYDLDNLTWKKYDTSSYISAGATLIGVCIQDTTNTVGARSFEFFKSWSDENTVELTFNSTTQMQSKHQGSGLSVWGETFRNDRSLMTWTMTTDLESVVTEGSSTYYYFYVTEDGDTKISDIRPYDRTEDLLGYYHPYQSWRCVGWAYNNASSNLTVDAFGSYFRRYAKDTILPVQTATANIEIVDSVIPLNSSGGAFTRYLPPAAYCRGKTLTFIKTNSDIAAITIDAYGSETINGATTIALTAQYECVSLLSDGVSWYIAKRTPKRDYIHLLGYNDHGSTNTRILRYDSTAESSLLNALFTYADSAANGMSITTNYAGFARISALMWTATSDNVYHGISKNSNELTTDIESITAANRLVVAGVTSGASDRHSVTAVWSGALAAGDVIRAHDSVNGSFADIATHFFFEYEVS